MFTFNDKKLGANHRRSVQCKDEGSVSDSPRFALADTGSEERYPPSESKMSQ